MKTNLRAGTLVHVINDNYFMSGADDAYFLMPTALDDAPQEIFCILLEHESDEIDSDIWICFYKNRKIRLHLFDEDLGNLKIYDYT